MLCTYQYYGPMPSMRRKRKDAFRTEESIKADDRLRKAAERAA